MGNVFEYIGAKHHVERRILKRKLTAIIVDHRPDPIVPIAARWQINCGDLKAPFREDLRLPPSPRTNLKNRPFPREEFYSPAQFVLSNRLEISDGLFSDPKRTKFPNLFENASEKRPIHSDSLRR